MSQRTFAQLQKEASLELEACGIDNAKLDCRILLSHAAGIEYYSLISMAKDVVPQAVAFKFLELVENRKTGKPVYRIIGKREFFGRAFEVHEDVLDPRPETELLVERILQDFDGRVAKFCEIGIGSGAISVSLLCEQAKLEGLGTDISNTAIKAASINANNHGVEDRLQIVSTDCLKGIEGPFDFVVSNPPYIISKEIDELQIEVKNHDPAIALDGGADGLQFYERIFDEAKLVLKEGGLLYLETGHGQHEDLSVMGAKKGWGLVSKHLDLSGLERIMVFNIGQE
ncbi:MAG: peptide chain release factor N(5)-glutamine methyltransferase [Nitratireductor sp.]